jgi:hypothetical protein
MTVQLDVEVFSVKLNALLASDEGETGTQFQQEHLQLSKDSVFKVPLHVMVLQIKEVEDVWIFENQGRTDLTAPLQGRELLPG